MPPILLLFSPYTCRLREYNISDATGCTPPAAEAGRSLRSLLAHAAGAKWTDKPYVAALAPVGWQQKHIDSPDSNETQENHNPDLSVCSAKCWVAWARLVAKVYEVDPMVCSRCDSPMRVLAIITDPEEVNKILRHLVKTGKPPPGLDASFLN